MTKQILITGGAGFIGSHLADALLARGHRVRILDSLLEQVHGASAKVPAYLNKNVELLIGDVRDRASVDKALTGIDVVYHLAAMVGVGQSMYAVSEYVNCNDLGTAVLLQALIEKPIERLIVASSMSVYGEGTYQTLDGRVSGRTHRSLEQLKAGDWNVRDSLGQVLIPAPTSETTSPDLNSVYALSKYSQERMCMMVGLAHGIPTVALRFFNVFGTRQALSNPYTGVIAIFASHLLNEKRPVIFEDGQQLRDFVSVHDVVHACCLALETPGAPGQVFNVGSGRPYSILEMANSLATALGMKGLTPEILGRYRAGDIRHCYADISRARNILGYEPRMSIEQGMPEIAEWIRGELAAGRVPQPRTDVKNALLI